MTTLVFFQNPRLLIVALFTIVASGVGSYWQLPRMEDPILKRRVGVVTTVYPGATASQMESLIAIPVEQELESLGSLKSIKSNCRANIANVVVELGDDVTDVDAEWSAIRDRIARLGERFPEASKPPELEVFPLKAFATIVAIHSDESEIVEVRAAANELKNRLYAIPGTESVSLHGDPGLELSVTITPGEMADHGITLGRLANEIERTVTGESIGMMDSDELRIQFTRIDSPGVAQRIRELSLVDFNGQRVTIEEIADVELRLQESTQEKCLIDGKESIVIAAMVDNDHHVDYWAKDLRNVLTELATQYPALEIDEIFSQQEHITGRMSRLFRNLMLSAVSVTLVVLLLMGWKSMVVVVVALPLTVFIVLTGMRLMSIPIHQMSVTGIIVSLGLLIDNAIVVVEEIRKKIFQGIRPFSAIRKSIHHLRFPLMGATVTTALSFLPIALLPGAAGEFVGAIAITVILAVVSSYFVAIMILPAIMGNIGIDPEDQGFFEYGISYQPLSDAYMRSLRFVLTRPWIGILFGVFLPAIGFLAWMHLPVQFFPPSDRQQIQIEVELSNASSFEALEETVSEVQQLVAGERRVQRQSWFLGKSAATFYYNVVPRRKNSPYYAQSFVELVEGDGSDSPQQLVQRLQSVVDQVDSARVTVRLLEQGPPFDSPIEVRVVGENRAGLTTIGNSVRRILAETPGVIQTRSDLSELIPGYEFIPDSDAFSDSSLSRSDVINALRAAIHGLDAGETVVGDSLVSIHVGVKYEPSDDVPSTLLGLPLDTAPSLEPGMRPTLLNAGMFGEFQVRSNAAAILRLNGNRVNEIKGYLQVGQLPAEVLQKFKERLEKADLQFPPGYRIEYGGENERRSTAVTNLMAFAPVFLMLILFLIVAIFRAFHAALYIALVGGLTIGLVPLTLAAFGYPFGFMAIVGAMGLIGIAINDSIVVMASLFSLNRDERSDVDVVAKSVFGNTRHIIATTLTTIAGFVPLVVGAGRFWPPMAIVLAGGILGATFLAIYFVPSVFVLSRRVFDGFSSAPNAES